MPACFCGVLTCKFFGFHLATNQSKSNMFSGYMWTEGLKLDVTNWTILG